MMNHYECAREMFYQIALNQFGNMNVAVTNPSSRVNTGINVDTTETGIDIEMIIGQYVQLEEILQQYRTQISSSTDVCDDDATWSTRFHPPFQVTDTNQALAKQATVCLQQHAEMLKDYFSIQIHTIAGKAYLTGLPILMEGYEPSTQGLPLFLLRLASEVDWSDEKRCFYGICRELGSYYAQIPSNMSDDEQRAMIQHVWFPAITTLLIPSKEIVTSEFVTITSLSKLYKVFERC
jgi:DNA mismatch repair protein MLH1